MYDEAQLRQLRVGSSWGPQALYRPGPAAEGKAAEAQAVLEGLRAQLPREARALVEKVNGEIERVREQAAEEAARLRARAEAQAAEVEGKAEGRRRALLREAAEQLEPMQRDLFRAGELGPALAVLVQVQALRGRARDVRPDPGTLLGYEQVGKAFHFRVTGATEGAVWGTDVYTADSHLATAAVHAGVLDPGEEGVVRVSVVDMACLPVQGSLRNGVQTHDWGPYAVGYRVARAEVAADNP